MHATDFDSAGEKLPSCERIHHDELPERRPAFAASNSSFDTPVEVMVEL
jgi:hypothetical protein